MIYIFDFSKISDTNYVVNCVHYLPFDPSYGLGKTEEELNTTGILIDTLPVNAVGEYQNSILHIDPTTKETWYEYVDIPKTEAEIQAEKMLALQTDFVTQKEINDQLILDNLNMQGQIDSLISSVLTV